MGRQIHPRGFRLGVRTSWDSHWYGSKQLLHLGFRGDHEMDKIRQFIRSFLKDHACLVGRIFCSFQPFHFHIHISMVSHEQLPSHQWNLLTHHVTLLLQRSSLLRPGSSVSLHGEQVSWQDMDATLLGEWMASELEKGSSFRQLKKYLQDWFLIHQKNNTRQGLRVQVKGRHQGAEIANKEWFALGKISLQTFASPIDYSQTDAFTLSGILGIKIWLG